MLLKKIGAISTIFVMLCMLTSNLSFARNDKNEMSDDEWQDRRAFLEENIIKLGGQGADKVESFLEDNGLEKVEFIKQDSGTVSVMSAPGSVNLYDIGGYYDQYSGRYLVSGYWKWGSIYSVDSVAGAYDGASLSMCQTTWDSVTGYVFESNPAGIAVYDQDGDLYSDAGGVTSISKSGIAYSFQDKWVPQQSSSDLRNKFCGFKGSVWFWLKTKPSQSSIYIKMDFMHTWSSATLNSVGIDWPVKSAPTLKMSFVSTPKNFSLANQITLTKWSNLF